MTVKEIRNMAINSRNEVYEMFGGFLCEVTNDEPSSIVDGRRVVYIQGQDDTLQITVC